MTINPTMGGGILGDIFGTGQGGKGFDFQGLIGDPLLQFGLTTLMNNGDMSKGLQQALVAGQLQSRNARAAKEDERENTRFEWEQDDRTRAQGRDDQWANIFNPQASPDGAQPSTGTPNAQGGGHPLIAGLSPQERALVASMPREAAQKYLLERMNRPTFETVQNPLGLGGVGQRNSLTGQLSGYQGPQTSEAPTAVREYEFARENGYEGSFAEFMQTVRRSPGTTVNVNNGGMDMPDDVPQFPGKSVGAGARNIILAVDEMRRQGREITPAQSDAYNLALKEVQSSTTDATFAANINQAQTDIAKGVEILFPDGLDGEFSRATSGLGGVPFTDARTARQSFRRAVEVLLRSRTGAAAPDSEVSNYMDAFYPSPLDTQEGARIKVQRLQQYFNDTAALRPRAFGESISNRGGQTPSNDIQKPADIPQAEWDNMPPEDKALFQ